MPDFSQPQSILLPDAGLIPNSHLPLLLYRSVAPDRRENLAAWFEQTFMGNNWRKVFSHITITTVLPTKCSVFTADRARYRWVANQART